MNTTITLLKISLGKMEVTSVNTYRRVAVMRLRRPLITKQTQLMYCSALSPSMISLVFILSCWNPRVSPKPAWCVHNSYLQFNLVQFNAVHLHAACFALRLTRSRVFETGVVELAKLLGCFVEPQFLDRFTVTEQVEKGCFSRPSFPNQKHLVWRCHDRPPALQNNCRKKFQAVKCEFTISLHHFYATACKRPKAGR